LITPVPRAEAGDAALLPQPAATAARAVSAPAIARVRDRAEIRKIAGCLASVFTAGNLL
jgi:hypothetical protein